MHGFWSCLDDLHVLRSGILRIGFFLGWNFWGGFGFCFFFFFKLKEDVRTLVLSHRDLQSNGDSPAAKAGATGVMKGSLFLRGTTEQKLLVW